MSMNLYISKKYVNTWESEHIRWKAHNLPGQLRKVLAPWPTCGVIISKGVASAIMCLTGSRVMLLLSKIYGPLSYTDMGLFILYCFINRDSKNWSSVLCHILFFKLSHCVAPIQSL